jgi:hypothetical protein
LCWEIADGRLSARGYDNFRAGTELDFDFGWLLVVIHRTETSAKEKAKRASSHQNGEKREREKRASEGEGGNTYATHGNTGESPAERNKLERDDSPVISRRRCGRSHSPQRHFFAGALSYCFDAMRGQSRPSRKNSPLF